MPRYFPELVAAVRAQLPPRSVVDGEVVVVRGDRLDFEALQQRTHPAACRVALLGGETPASFIAFDLLALDGESLMERPFAERRAALAEALGGTQAPVHLTLSTDSERLPPRWVRAVAGGALDGVIAKPHDLPYLPDQRVMFKVKHERTADCVVAGFRWHKKGPVVGSLVLGLYDDNGKLQHCGVSASFSMERRRELLDELAPYPPAEGAADPP